MKLFIIGNGFDRRHKCETGYDSFKEFLQTNSYMIGDFELSHYFNGLDKKLWDDFENELENIDFGDQMEYYIADTNPDLPDGEFEHNVSLNAGFQESFEEALKVFHSALCQAISDFVIEATSGKIDKKSYFSDIMKSEDVFITFNYTRLLENVYKVDENNINHIHGIANPRYRYKDDDLDSYGEPTIIFGHGNLRKTPKIHRNYEYNPFYPQKCLKALNQELKKDYQFDELKSFVMKYKDDIDTVEIIGHNLGEVDEQYFKELNKLLPKQTKINYWLYNEDEEDEKRGFLNSNLHGHPIQIKYYPEED